MAPKHPAGSHRTAILRSFVKALNALRMILQSATWTESDDSSADTALTLTHTATAGKSHHITSVDVVLRTVMAGGSDVSIELREDTDRKWRTYIGAGAPRGRTIHKTFTNPIQIRENVAAKLVIGAAGAGTVVTANMAGYTA